MGGRTIRFNATVLITIVLCLLSKSQSVAYLSDHVKIAKCCPQGSELIVVTDKTGLKTDYQCSETREDDELNETFFGYNLEITNSSQIPTCGDVLLFDIDVDGELISSDGCIDMYKGVLHGLTCSEMFKVEIHKLFKCCTKGRTTLKRGTFFCDFLLTVSVRLYCERRMKLFNYDSRYKLKNRTIFA